MPIFLKLYQKKKLNMIDSKNVNEMSYWVNIAWPEQDQELNNKLINYIITSPYPIVINSRMRWLIEQRKIDPTCVIVTGGRYNMYWFQNETDAFDFATTMDEYGLTYFDLRGSKADIEFRLKNNLSIGVTFDNICHFFNSKTQEILKSVKLKTKIYPLSRSIDSINTHMDLFN